MARAVTALYFAVAAAFSLMTIVLHAASMRHCGSTPGSWSWVCSF